MDRYILNLYKQYCDSKGIIFEPANIKSLESGFNEWIVQNRILSKKYKEYLLSLGYIDSKLVYEIGKGKYDIISCDKSRVISPYAETFEHQNATLFIIGNTPLIESSGKIIIPDTDVFLTHNPYDETFVNNWFRIHNAGLYDVSIGMYGSVYDEDFDAKIKIIEELSKNMTNDHTIDYDTDKDNYFCSLNSKRKVKVKILKK